MGNRTSSASKGCDCLSPNRRHRQTHDVVKSHHTQTSHWIPPPENWDSGDTKLPYGWEGGVDKEGKQYFINHVDKVTTSNDPRDDPDYLEPPKPRDVELVRDPQMGFGFVAGSEKPVIVRFVTEGGPSVDKLLPGDQIIKINGEDVKMSPREYVIDLVRSCKESMVLTVCQPYADNSERKSALLTAAKKAKLKNHPSRVRFAEAVTVNGAAVTSPSTHESYIPFMPNVLKVFLENGQTKSFKYDNTTTVQDVVNSLQEKLSIEAIEYFALVLQNTKSPSHSKLSVLQENEMLAEIAARPGSEHFKCLFRVAFVPREPTHILEKDKTAFEYFYTQCCNDVIQERFASELKYETALRLAALHIYQHALGNNVIGKISLKAYEKECGMERFVPKSVLGNVKGKDLRKMLNHYLKELQNTAATSSKMSELEAKLNYLRIVMELRSCGGRSFVATWVEKRVESMILVGSKSGISHITNIRQNLCSQLCDFHEIESLDVTKETEMILQVVLRMKCREPQVATLSMLNDDMHDFLALIEGYHHLLVGSDSDLQVRRNEGETNVPPFHAEHTVIPAPWSYAPESVEGSEKENTNPDQEQEIKEEKEENMDTEPTRLDNRVVDFRTGPPRYSEAQQVLPFVDDEEEEDKENQNVIASIPATLSADQGSNISQTTSKISEHSNQLVITNHKPSAVEPISSHHQIEDILAKCDNETSVDNDSETDSSTLSVIKRSDSLGGSTFDVRLGVKCLRTFAAEDDPPPVTRTDASAGESEPNNAHALENVSSEHCDEAKEHISDIDDYIITSPEERLLKLGNSIEVHVTEDEAVATETNPLLGEGDTEEGAEFLPSESDDTDSVSTPMDSPLKKRLGSLDLSPPPLFQGESESHQSFGLHSPDNLHMSEEELQAIAKSYGLSSPDQLQTDMGHPGYNPRLFCDGGLYLDPDIIDLSTDYTDLTLIPPPKTPDGETLIDFSVSETSAPPPGFGDEGRHRLDGEDVMSLVMDLPQSILDELDLIGSTEELESKLGGMDALLIADAQKYGDLELDTGQEIMTSQEVISAGAQVMAGNVDNSAGIPKDQQEFFSESDIDVLIAKLIVPPPPTDIRVSESGVSSDVKELCLPPPDEPPTFPSPQKLDFSLESLPPPPVLHEQGADLHMHEAAFKAQACEVELPPYGVTDMDCSLEEEFAALILPPPPSNEEPSIDLESISIVPPVSMDTISHDHLQPINDFTVHPPVSDVITDDKFVLPEPVLPTGFDNVPKVFESSKVNTNEPNNEQFTLNSSVGDAGMSYCVTISPNISKTNLGHNNKSVDIRGAEHKSHVEKPKTFSTFQGTANEPVFTVELREKKGRSVSAGNSPVHRPQTLKPWESPTAQRRKRMPPPPPPRRSSYHTGSLSLLCETSSLTSVSPDEPQNELTPDLKHPMSRSVERLSQPLALTDVPLESNDQAENSGQKRHSKVTSKIMELEKLFKTKKGMEYISSGADQEEASETEDHQMATSSGESKNEKKGFSQQTVSNPNSHPYADLEKSNPPLAVRRTNSAEESVIRPNQFGHRPPLKQQNSLPLSLGQNIVAHQRSSSLIETRCSVDNDNYVQMHNGVTPGAFHERTASFNDGTSARRRYMQMSDDQSDRHSSTSLPTSPRHFVTDTAILPGTRPRRLPRTVLPPAPPKRSTSKEESDIPKEPSGADVSFTSQTLPRFFRPGSAVSGTKKGKDTKKMNKNTTSNGKTSKNKTNGGPSEMFPVPSSTSDVTSPISSQRERQTFSTFHEPAQAPSSDHIGKAANTSNRPSPEMRVRPTSLANLNQNGRPPHLDDSASVSSYSSEHSACSSNSDRSGHIKPTRSPSFINHPHVLSIESKSYEGSEETTFQEVKRDINHLVKALEETMDLFENTQNCPSGEEFRTCKDALVSESRQFVTDSKLLVSSATQSKEKLVVKMDISMHTLAKIVHQCQRTMMAMTSIGQGQELGSRVKDVALAYQMTVTAAHAAAGRPLGDASMKVLMRQATNLAAILSSLMKTLKVTDDR